MPFPGQCNECRKALIENYTSMKSALKEIRDDGGVHENAYSVGIAHHTLERLRKEEEWGSIGTGAIDRQIKLHKETGYFVKKIRRDKLSACEIMDYLDKLVDKLKKELS